MGIIRRLYPSQFWRQAFDRILEFGMRAAALKELKKMLPQDLFMIAGHFHLSRECVFNLAAELDDAMEMKTRKKGTPESVPCEIDDGTNLEEDYFWTAAVFAGVVSSRDPIASPDKISSTRRFCCRPSEVSLEAMGSVLPKPCDSTDAA